MTWKTRRYLATFAAAVFLILSGTYIGRLSSGDSGAMLWFITITALIAGVANLAAMNQYANREVDETRSR